MSKPIETIHVREERMTGDLDAAVGRNLDRFFAPLEPHEVFSMGRVFFTVPALAATAMAIEDEIDELEGNIKAWGHPLYPQTKPIRKAIHKYFQQTRSISGAGSDQATEVLTPGVTRLPAMMMPYGQEHYGAQQESDQEKEEKKKRWL